MDKSSFAESVEAPVSVAESAWETAEGDEEKARELLSPDTYRIKGRFSDLDDGFFGLFSFNWYVESSTTSDRKQVVGSDESLGEISPSTTFNQFNRSIESALSEGTSMGGYTEQFADTLEKKLSDSSSSIYGALANDNLDQLESAFKTVLEDELDLSNVSVLVEWEVVRTLDKRQSQDPTSETPDSSESEVELQCDVEINPVKGIPVTKVKPGHEIYVDINDDSASHRNIVRKLESQTDNSGMVPARVISKHGTQAGNVRIEVKFDDNVTGNVRCGKDVSILVPESTKDQIDGAGQDLPDFLTDEIFLGTAIAVVILLIIGLWFFAS